MSVSVNIHEAKTHLSRLLELAAKGQEVVIAKAGKPMARLVPYSALPAERALGFFADQGVMEVDVKEAFADDMASMFDPSC